MQLDLNQKHMNTNEDLNQMELNTNNEMNQEESNTESAVFFERMQLALDRLQVIVEEKTVPQPFCAYFQKTGKFLLFVHELATKQESGALKSASLEEKQQLNKELYEDIVGEAYEESYGNPAYSVKVLGKEFGQMLSMLYAELRGMIVYAYEQRKEELLIFTELFLQVYSCFEGTALEAEANKLSVEELGQEAYTKMCLPTQKEVKDILYWFFSDYSDLFMEQRVSEQVDDKNSFATDIIMNADLTDIRYLYDFGEYITENELVTAAYLNELPQEEIDAMAHTMSEGYRKGFENANKDLSIKDTVNIRYHLGFERIIRQVIKDFDAMGLQPVIYRKGASSVYSKVGYEGANPNPQFSYDHKADNGLYLDKRYVERRLGALKAAYEIYKIEAKGHGGPAVMEVFGEIPFVPVVKEESIRLTEKQQKLSVELQSGASKIVNKYIPQEERSFTIIAFPLPEIGDNYKEIFREIVKINTLDYQLYQNMQQALIDALDQGEKVHIKGKDGNKTDLTVKLYPLNNPEKETIFENCVADVNIPVGEVFTSPVLEGTNGTLFVSKVYLEELLYENLEITFEEGMVKTYTCTNFDSKEENEKYIKENVLNYHDTLPMGEFAIGTNTTAYVMARKYDIADKLPILIAEKMGPHFAVGDTCYSHEEDLPLYNSDGKEIVARDNSCSLKRKEDLSKAYFNTHVDITIPYDELEKISVLCKDGEEIVLLRDGRFLLPGTEGLNEPFEE